jgi:hypothetical protein
MRFLGWVLVYLLSLILAVVLFGIYAAPYPMNLFFMVASPVPVALVVFQIREMLA